MSTIPPDVREQVQEFALEHTNAFLADDHSLAASLYERFLAYHEEQLAVGRSHPFIVETLADYTQDHAQSVRYYKQALTMSRQMASDEPTHTILIGIGARLIELGRREQAEAFIRDGRAEAVRREDSFFIEEADRLLNETAD